MEYLSIDRIEEGIAVCEAEDRSLYRIPLTEIAGSPREGDVICLHDGVWQVSPEETARRREAVLRLQRQLFED